MDVYIKIDAPFKECQNCSYAEVETVVMYSAQGEYITSRSCKHEQFCDYIINRLKAGREEKERE